MHEEIRRLLYRYLLAHIEMVMAFHSVLWGSWLLAQIAYFSRVQVFSVLFVIVPAWLLGSALIVFGTGLIVAIIRRNLVWRRRLLWLSAHTWLLIAVATIVASLSSLSAINYLFVFVMHISEYLRISVALDDQRAIDF